MTLAFDDDHAPLYTVGQVAGMLEVQPAFLRRLDSEQVVQPARSDGGQRRYSRADIARVQQVTRMAERGDDRWPASDASSCSKPRCPACAPRSRP